MFGPGKGGDLRVIEEWEPIYVGFVNTDKGRKFAGKLYSVARVEYTTRANSKKYIQALLVNGTIYGSGSGFRAKTRSEMRDELYDRLGRHGVDSY